MTNRLVNPMGCRWCGVDQRGHAQQWKPPVGWHKWEQPAQQQIKQRMFARRNPRSSMTTTQTLIPTTTGPVAVDATQAAPGLITFPSPEGFRPDCPYRWLLAHHQGHVIAAFETEEAADQGAVRIASVVDWTKSIMTAAQQISLSLEGGSRAFLALVKEVGGHDPNGT